MREFGPLGAHKNQITLPEYTVALAMNGVNYIYREKNPITQIGTHLIKAQTVRADGKVSCKGFKATSCTGLASSNQ